MAKSTGTSKYLDPAALAKLKNLHLAARLVVEGLYAGRHRSPHKGFSVEFAEHREYVPGDEPRYIDWKILGKRDKLYVKQYEEQTNLRCYLVLDASASMNYRHEGAMTKLDYARYCAAALAYLMQTQHDAFGLIVHDSKIRKTIPPRQGMSHLKAVLDELENVEPGGETDLAGTFHELAERSNRRALIVTLSDLFGGDTGELIDALGHLRHRKHEVIALQMLDRAELEFPFDNAGQIRDMETGGIITADAEAIRRHYLQSLNDYLERVRVGCQMRGIGYALADTLTPFDTFLSNYLTQRERMSAAKVT